MTISFNISVSGNKDFLKEYTAPVQIMPQTVKSLSMKFVNAFPEIITKRLGCVHTSYITRPFSEKILTISSFGRKNIIDYLSLAKRIGFEYILIHGPESTKEWEYLTTSLELLHDITKDDDSVKIIIEMPSFKGDFLEDLKKYMKYDIDLPIEENTPIKYVSYYFNKIIEHGYDIVLDTAHLYANGCSIEDTIELFKIFKDNMKICHLNGNKNKQFTSDAHCPIFSEKNKMGDVTLLIKYLATTDLIMITENASDGVEYKQWEQFAATYGLKIVPYHENLNC